MEQISIGHLSRIASLQFFIAPFLFHRKDFIIFRVGGVNILAPYLGNVQSFLLLLEAEL